MPAKAIGKTLNRSPDTLWETQVTIQGTAGVCDVRYAYVDSKNAAIDAVVRKRLQDASDELSRLGANHLSGMGA